MDDDPVHLQAVCRLLSGERWNASGFGSAEEALEGLERDAGAYGVLLTGLNVPGPGDVDLLRTVREWWPSVTPVLMTDEADLDRAIDAIESGAYDYLVKPIDGPALIRTLGRARERSRLLSRNLYVERQLGAATLWALPRWTDRLPPLAEAREAFERRYARDVLARAEGSLPVAARMAGLDRSNFRRLLRRLGLEAPPSSAPARPGSKSDDPS